MNAGAVDAPTGVDEPAPGRPPSDTPPGQTVPWTLRGFARSQPWWMVGVAIGVLSVAVVVWARTRPGFDPYGWLVWGHQTLHLALDTNAAPSWKPLPYLFTVPFAVVGHYAVYLWLVTVVAFSLGGSVFAGRIAYRLVAGEPGGPDGAQVDRRGRIAGWVAAVVAGVGVLLIAGDSHVILSGQSDPMIVGLCLGAIDMQLSRRYRWALAFWLLASLGRPEAWPFLGLYVIWAWRAVPSMRRVLIGAVVLLLVLWFGIPAITSRSPFVAGSNAFGSGRAPHGNKATATVSRFAHLQPVVLSVLALLVGGVGGLATRAGGAADGGRDRAVGRRRDRVRPARMAGGAAVHVRGRRSARGDRRDRRRVADPRARAMVGRGGMGRRGAGLCGLRGARAHGGLPGPSRAQGPARAAGADGADQRAASGAVGRGGRGIGPRLRRAADAA